MAANDPSTAAASESTRSLTDADRSGPGGLSELAYVQLRERLVTLQIPPGAPLEEDVLMAQLRLGRTPVREAIKRLSLENLVAVYPRRGTFATHVDVTDLALISDVRAPLEGHAALRAAQRLTAADRAELGRLRRTLTSRRQERARGTPMELKLDGEVHRFVYRCARNSYLAEILERYYALSLRLWYLVLDRLPPLPARVDEHVELLDLLDRGDAAAARDRADAHVRAFEQGVRALL